MGSIVQMSRLWEEQELLLLGTRKNMNNSRILLMDNTEQMNKQ